jgi:hypothetical protein
MVQRSSIRSFTFTLGRPVFLHYRLLIVVSFSILEGAYPSTGYIFSFISTRWKYRLLVSLRSRSRSSKSQFLVRSVPCWCICCVLPYVHPFQVLRTTLSRARTFPTALSLHRASIARWIVLVLEATSSLRGWHFSWVRYDFTMSLLRCATVARRDIFRSIGVFRATFARRVVPLRATAVREPRGRGTPVIRSRYQANSIKFEKTLCVLQWLVCPGENVAVICS